MSFAFFSFTARGKALETRLCGELDTNLKGVRPPALQPPRRFAAAGSSATPADFRIPLQEQVKAAFSECGALIFIGAAGIAVRLIAPCLQSKLSDPAVIVIDEAARYVIPLAGGHIGGANELAQYIALILNAEAVITTATDINGVFAVDVWAKKNELIITSAEKAKIVSAKLLNGEEIQLESCLPLTGTTPVGIKLSAGYADLSLGQEKVNFGIVVTPKKQTESPPSAWLCLIPRCVYLGIGCKKGKTAAEISETVRTALEANLIDDRSLAGIASIDIKRGEAGLEQFARDRNLPLEFFNAEQLMAARGNFSHSDFAESVTGADNVCERAAFLAADSGKLIAAKMAHNGVTVAAALQLKELHFD